VPVLADCDPHSLTLLPEEIERRLTWKTRGVLMLHYGGHPHPRMQDILSLCGQYGLWLVEDAANCPASTWQGQAVGTLGDAGCWSFDSMKIMVMGSDGGALWLRAEDSYRRAVILRNMGLNKLSGYDAAQRRDVCWWENTIVRLWDKAWPGDVGAAIGRAQLRKLPEFIARRARIWATYQQELAGVGDLVLPPEPAPDCTSSYYLYWVQTGKRDALARFLYGQGVYTTLKYYPLHWSMKTGAHLPGAEHAADTTLCLPLHQGLSDDDVQKVISHVKEFYA
jgi:aminotransferase